MEGRMTVCNMTIEGGGRAGMIAPDETTFEYVIGRPGAPSCGAGRLAHAAHRRWGGLRPRDRRRRGCAQPDGHLGDESRDGRPGHRRGSPSRVGAGRARARLHGARGGHADRADQAGPRIHRLMHELTDRRPQSGSRDGRQAAVSPTASTRWSCRDQRRSRRRPSPRGSIRSFAQRGSTGAAPVARCVWG